MSFLHPEFLYYMLPPLFILFGLLLTQKEAQAHYFAQDVMERLRVSANTLTLKARNALFFLIGVLLVIALAGPVIQEGVVEVKAKSADIMLALDISDSMLAEDVYPNRLKLAKQKALRLLELAPNERIGVIAFAKNSYLVSPLSFDHDAVKFLLSKLDTNSITEQGTNFLSMLEVVAQSMNKDAKKYLLVLSDGGDKKDFTQEIAFAKKHDISVFVLAIGTQKGAPVKTENGEFIKQNGKIIVSKLNENIALLATKTGGVYIQSINADTDVKAMLREIEKNAQKKELKSQKIQKYIPLFYYPLGLALLLLLIATSSMSSRKKVEVPGAFLLFGLLVGDNISLHAGVLDFMQLDKAHKAYEQKEYQKAAKLYENYANNSEHAESYYNAANALYKAKKYKEAVKMYEKARFDTKEKRADSFANMGNAYAKIGTQKSLEEAVASYEASLKLREDKATRENLEEVKKVLDKLKQKQQQKKQQNQQNKQDKNKQKKQNQKNKQNQNKQGKQGQEKNNKDNKQQNQHNKNPQNNKADAKGKNKTQQSKQDKQKDAQNKVQKQTKQEHKSKKDALKELQEKKEDQKKAQHAAASSKKVQMSDAEEKKWMQKLNATPSTFLYMLNKNNKVQKESGDEKPW